MGCKESLFLHLLLSICPTSLYLMLSFLCRRSESLKYLPSLFQGCCSVFCFFPTCLFLPIPLPPFYSDLPSFPSHQPSPKRAGRCQVLCFPFSSDMLLMMVRWGNTTLYLLLSIFSILLLALFPVTMSCCCKVEKIN